jgi:GTP-binding protein
MGGRGNTHFVTSTRRAPAFAELGEPAQEGWIELEMKLMADAALVGVPSAGKSSLISKMSAAKPKIADYPFTTLVPNLGVCKSGDLSFVAADVPGLIEGAAEGRGLGHEFLRHIERTALIVHVIDMTGGWEGRDPLEDYDIINRELELYSPEFAMRPRIVVANKCDMPGLEVSIAALAERVAADSAARLEVQIAAAAEARLKAVDVGVDEPEGATSESEEQITSLIDPKLYCISALTGEGVRELKAAIASKVHDLRVAAAEAAAAEAAAAGAFEQVWEHKRDARNAAYEVVEEEPGAFRVSGRQVERMVVQTDWENEEALAFLQHRLRRLGVEDALAAAGAQNGDEVRICGRAFEYESANAPDVYAELDL